MDVQLTPRPESQPVPSESKPRPFHEIPPLWLQVPHMDEAFFAAEVVHTSDLNTFLSVLVYAAIATGSVVPSLGRLALNAGQATSSIGLAAVIGACVTLFGGPLAFYLNTAMYFLSARLFGGKGTFSRQAYLHTLYFVPLSAVSSLGALLNLVPVVGRYIAWLILLAVLLTDLFFQTRMFKVVHGFNTGRAAAAVITPFVLIFGLVCLCVVAIAALALMSPAIGNVFSSINQSLPTPVP